jgi:hypothetical protein
MRVDRLIFVLAVGVAACSPQSNSPSSAALSTSSPAGASTSAAVATASIRPSSSASAAATSSIVFESATYHYSVHLPAGWTAAPASVVWDGSGAPGYDDPAADRFSGPASAAAFAFGAPTQQVLSAYVASVTADNFKFHGDTCPEKPEVVEPITIGGEPGTLIAWNCGILINVAATVHRGTGYHFVFRDPAVHAATDPTDKAVFLALLSSVTFGT